MQCPKCQHENREGAKFCDECGARLVGSILSTPTLDISKTDETREQLPVTKGLRRSIPQDLVKALQAQGGRIEGERRQVTVLFADIAEFTPMCERLDPEQVTNIVNRCFSALGEVIYKYEGTIERFMGDCIMVLFGAPIAHEDDAERAIHAALEMKERLRGLNEELSRGIPKLPELSLHVGINTGLVVAGGVGTALQQDYTVMGIAVNLASRLEHISEAGEILIGPDTYHLVQQVFETEERGPVRLRGISDPVSFYAVKRARPGVVRPRGIAGLHSEVVGRETEFTRLKSCIDNLLNGSGQIVTVMGEAGIGKSRLVAETRGYASDRDLTWIEGRALSYGHTLTYWPWMEILRKAAGITEEDGNERIISKLCAIVEELLPERPLHEVIPFITSVLSVDVQGELAGGFPQMPPNMVREHVFGSIRDLLNAMARSRPLVLVLEDMHWSDPSSVEVLKYLMGVADTSPLMLISVFRPYTDASVWQFKVKADSVFPHRYTEIYLEPLSVEDSAQLVANLMTIENMDADTQDMILAKTEGNPFFLEEVLRSLLDSEIVIQQDGKWLTIREITALDIPDTVQGVLLARIDRLEEDVRRVLQMASVIGRTFLYRVLGYITEAEAELDTHLAQLQDVELIRERTRIPELEYIFKHVLTQEAAYSTILIERKKEIHRRVAECIETLYADRLEENYGLIAHHYEYAEMWAKAVGYLQKAGDKTVRQSANAEAIGHFGKGLELLKMLPDSPQRDEQELGLRISIYAPLVASGKATEIGEVFDRAQDLCLKLGKTDQLFQVLLGLCLVNVTQEEFQTAHKLAEQCLILAESAQDSSLLLESNRIVEESLFLLGELTRAQTHLERALDIYSPQEHHSHVFRFGQDPGVALLAFSSWILWLLGYPDQAMDKSNRAINLARELEHPYSLALALSWATVLHCFRREPHTTRERVEESISLSIEHGLAFCVSMGSILRGWALAEQGQVDEGIAQILQGIETNQAYNVRMWRQYSLFLLAEVYGKTGRAEEGLDLLDEALNVMERSKERWWEGELYRLKGELMLIKGETESDAEIWLRKAIQVTHQQKAKSLELRAVMSLCRLLQKQGRREEARQMLSDIYNCFTEGFDTPDLKEARTLLERLSQS